ncbi:MAG: hypothetical protein RLZZ241_2399 [Bacteroidota bacterium]|jgi:hypothetical protein
MIRHLKSGFLGLLPVFSLLMLSCNQEQKSNTSVYFGGEVVNPTSDRVVLFLGEQAIDSAMLDVDNHFEMRLDTLSSGLYHFFHRPEMQYVYLEPGDSLQLRLNTTSFDESLAFSGTGEAINNYLINSFLESENDEQMIRDSLIPLEPGTFIRRMDQLLQDKLEQLNQLRIDEQLSNSAFEMAKASLAYKNYYYRESYPFWHRKVGTDKTFHQIPASYYKYRQQISYSNTALAFLRPYYEFMIYHVGNLAYMNCQEGCENGAETAVNQLRFNEHRLKLIDSLIPKGELRDNLFRTVAFDYLLKHSNGYQVDEFMALFNRVSVNNRHSNEIEALSQAISNLTPGSPLPDLKVFDVAGNEVQMQAIKPNGAGTTQVFYFWSGREPRHLEALNARIAYLKTQHPELTFIGIALRTDSDQWTNLIGQYTMDSRLQFRSDQFETFAHTLVIYHPYKILMSKGGKVLDGFANLNTSF